MRYYPTNKKDSHHDRIKWLNQHVGPTTGGRRNQEVGKGWQVTKFYSAHSWVPVVAYTIDDEKKAVLFQLRWP